MGLRDDLQTTPISRTNVRPSVTIHKSADVRTAVQTMRAARLGVVIVVDDEEKAVGIFTEGILRHCLNESIDRLDDCVADQMATRLPWALPSEPIGVVLDAMEEHNIRFIAVLDDDRHVVGITGQKTLMEFIADCFPREILTQDPTGVSFSWNREGA